MARMMIETAIMTPLFDVEGSEIWALLSVSQYTPVNTTTLSHFYHLSNHYNNKNLDPLFTYIFQIPIYSFRIHSFIHVLHVIMFNLTVIGT